MNHHVSVKERTKTDSEFARDTLQGLSSVPKYLKSKYFYDNEGDKLFQKIMALSEYYLTDCEFEILNHHKNELMDFFSDSNCAIFSINRFISGTFRLTFHQMY